MKAWHVVLILVLVGAGGVAAWQQTRYQELLEEARVDARRLEVQTLLVDSLVHELGQALVDLDRARQQRAQDSIQAAQQRRALRQQLTVERQESDRLEANLREHLTEEEQPLLDSLDASHARELATAQAETEVVEEELAGVQLLLGQTDARLTQALVALEECQCALEQAEVTVAAYEEAASSQGLLSDLWGFMSSTKGVVTIGAIGLGAWGLHELLTDDEPRYRYPEEYQPGVVFSLTW